MKPPSTTIAESAGIAPVKCSRPRGPNRSWVYPCTTHAKSPPIMLCETRDNCPNSVTQSPHPQTQTSTKPYNLFGRSLQNHRHHLLLATMSTSSSTSHLRRTSSSHPSRNVSTPSPIPIGAIASHLSIVSKSLFACETSFLICSCDSISFRFCSRMSAAKLSAPDDVEDILRIADCR